MVDGTANVTISFTFQEDPLFTLMHETTHASVVSLKFADKI